MEIANLLTHAPHIMYSFYDTLEAPLLMLIKRQHPWSDLIFELTAPFQNVSSSFQAQLIEGDLHVQRTKGHTQT
jgi:hypothetical protein